MASGVNSLPCDFSSPTPPNFCLKSVAIPFPMCMSSLTQCAREAELGQENRSPLTSEKYTFLETAGGFCRPVSNGLNVDPWEWILEVAVPSICRAERLVCDPSSLSPQLTLAPGLLMGECLASLKAAAWRMGPDRTIGEPPVFLTKLSSLPCLTAIYAQSRSQIVIGLKLADLRYRDA